MKKIAHFSAFLVVFLVTFSLQGWSQSAPAQAFKNVTIHTADGNKINKGTIVWRDGIITNVGKNVVIPFDAYVRDGGDSLHVYPGFIDGMATWGSPEVEKDVKTPEEPGNPEYERAGIQSHRSPSTLLENDSKELVEGHKYGFSTAALGLQGKMLPGQIDLFFVQGTSTKDNVLQKGIAQLAQFEEAQGQAYPSTIMGLMTQFRQLFNDAKALQEQEHYFASVSSNYPSPKKDKVLEALFPVMDNEQPFFFIADSKENIERMFWLQDELGFEVVLISGKEAHAKADELNQRNIPVLASIDLPDEPEWRSEENEEEKPEVTEEMRIFRDRQLQDYKADINNISKLIESGVKVGFSSNGLELKELKKNLQTLNDEGNLSNDEIINILTQSTADILGFGERMGDLESGTLANFTVFTAPPLEDDSKAAYSIANGEITEFEQESSEE